MYVYMNLILALTEVTCYVGCKDVSLKWIKQLKLFKIMYNGGLATFLSRSLTGFMKLW